MDHILSYVTEWMIGLNLSKLSYNTGNIHGNSRMAL